MDKKIVELGVTEIEAVVGGAGWNRQGVLNQNGTMSNPHRLPGPGGNTQTRVPRPRR